MPGVVVGVGSDVPNNPQPERFRQKYNIRGPFAVYVGRIDENKGCKELFEFFQALSARSGRQAVARADRQVAAADPEHPRIRHLGFLDDADKFDAMAAAELLIMPSYFESLSMVALEAWALGRPVLANGRCDVLKGQCIRSNAGLYYETLRGVRRDAAGDRAEPVAGQRRSGRNGRQFFREHYDWPVIERKYLDMFERLKKEPPRAADGAAARLVRAPAPGPAAGRTERAAARRCRRGRSRRDALVMRIHQVLATLGYGDAIGHEVLGIQRVLRAAGYESEIFVETADHRLEPLTRDYRELVDASHPDNLLLHHFSLGSKASRTAFALPDRMALIYHNITPPEYFVGVHRTLARQCFRGRRELQAYVDRCDLALGDSEFNRQDLEALGFPRTAVLPVVPGFLAPRSARRTGSSPTQFDDDWTNILFVGRVIAEQEDRGPDPLLPRLPHDVQPAIAAADRRRRTAGSSATWRRCTTWSPSSALPHVHFVGHVSDEELVAYYEVADLFLCASEHEGFCVPLVEAFYKQVPVLAYAATAVPATMDGAGVLYDDKDPIARRGADGRDRRRTPALQDAIVDGQLAAVERLRAKDFAGTLLGFVDEILVVAARAGSRRSRSTSGSSSTPPRSSRSCRLLPARRSTRRCRQRAMIVNQWVPAAHKGDAIGDSARRVRDLLRAHGPRVRALRADDRRRARRRRAAVQRSGGATRRRHDLPLRAAVADDRGVRVARRAAACCSTTT